VAAFLFKVKMRTKQKVFIQEYLKDFNATQAAIRAGYSEHSARAIGSENLTKPDIADEIKAQVTEKIMSEDEIRMRLADIARGDLADLMAISSVGFNFELMTTDSKGNRIVNPKTKLIRKIKQKVTTHSGRKEDSDDTEIIETELELYNAQQALEFLAKLAGLVTDKTDVTLSGAISVELAKKALGKIYGDDNATG
jgi:phage terminase small subunit